MGNSLPGYPTGYPSGSKYEIRAVERLPRHASYSPVAVTQVKVVARNSSIVLIILIVHNSRL